MKERTNEQMNEWTNKQMNESLLNLCIGIYLRTWRFGNMNLISAKHFSFFLFQFLDLEWCVCVYRADHWLEAVSENQSFPWHGRGDKERQPCQKYDEVR